MKPESDACSLALPIKTAEGTFIACYSEKGLACLDFPDRARPLHNASPTIPRQIQQWHRLTVQALTRVLAGKAPQALPPMDLSQGTEFQQRVWAALRTIATGETRSYSEVAGKIGKPKAVRAVGGACGANPIPVLVPCHRVLAAHHRLGGFSGGLDWKRRLLAREGVRLSGQDSRSQP